MISSFYVLRSDSGQDGAPVTDTSSSAVTEPLASPYSTDLRDFFTYDFITTREYNQSTPCGGRLFLKSMFSVTVGYQKGGILGFGDEDGDEDDDDARAPIPTSVNPAGNQSLKNGSVSFVHLPVPAIDGDGDDEP